MLFWTGMKMHEIRRYEATDMRRITEALNQIVHSIECKNVLEIACGSGEFPSKRPVCSFCNMH